MTKQEMRNAAQRRFVARKRAEMGNDAYLAMRRKQWHERYSLKEKASQYGISPSEADTTGCVCEVCGGQPASGKKLCIDHNHATGVVRGFLCTSCNIAIGMMKDSPERLRRAAMYIEEKNENKTGSGQVGATQTEGDTSEGWLGKRVGGAG